MTEHKNLLDNAYLIAKVGAVHHKILPYFLDYYIHEIGISPDNCIIVVHDNESGYLDQTIALLKDYGISPFKIWRGPFSQIGVVYHFFKTLMAVPEDGWVIPADTDEFNFKEKPLTQLIEECETHGYDYVLSDVIDMVAEEGIPELNSNMSLWQQFPKESKITEYIGRGMVTKLILMRPYVIPECGGFHGPSRRYKRCYIKHPEMQRTYHFKWHGDIYQIMKNFPKPISERICDYIDNHKSLVVIKKPLSLPIRQYIIHKIWRIVGIADRIK